MRKYSEFIVSSANEINRIGVIDQALIGSQFMLDWKSFEDRLEVDNYDVLSHPGKYRTEVLRITELLYALDRNATSGKDCIQLIEKDREYGGSWVKRGGIGAFFAAVRKFDRIETQLAKSGDWLYLLQYDTREEGILDDIGDLRRYLILWNAWWMAQDLP